MLRGPARFAPLLLVAATVVAAEGCDSEPDDARETDDTTSSTATSIASTSTAGGAGGGSMTTAGVGGDTVASSSSGSVMQTDCTVDGISGDCIDFAECDAMDGWVSTPGFCPGPAAIQCCTESPATVENPPIPTGYKFMMQSEVTPEMTQWAVDILHDPVGHPMFSTDTKTFGSLFVLARVEWHPPDFLNAHVHRGVTLYEPL